MPLENRVCFLVNLRDHLRCRRCGRRPLAREGYHSGFEYHHVRPRCDGGADEAENVVLLCHDCHRRLHRGEPVSLADVPPLPKVLVCKNCTAVLDPKTVEMNCGWYRCGTCGGKTSLFAHFDGAF